MNGQSKIQQYDFKPAPYELEVKSLSPLWRQHELLLGSPHRINFYDIIWIQSGNPVYVVDFQRIEIEPGSLLFVNKNQVHFYESFNDCEGMVLLFTDNFFCKTTDDASFLSNTVLFNDLLHVPYIKIETGDETIPQQFAAIQKELENTNDHLKHTILQNQVHNLLLYAERAYRKKGLVQINAGPDLELVLVFRDLVNRHFHMERSVAFYASRMMITEKRLQKITAQVFGKSPKAYLHDRIILEAKRLLLHSQSNSKSIAFELGFDEPTNFIKYFRKHTRMTPGEFRESCFPS